MTEKIYEKLAQYVHNNFSEYGNRIIGSEELFRSAVLVPFVEIDGVESILFEKRAQNIRQGGEICFPGGRVDDEDESTIETVIRETIEETGITRSKISVHESAGYLVTRIGALIEVYIGRMEISSLEELSPNPDEVDRLFTIPVSFFLENEPEHYSYKLTIEPWYDDETGQRIDLFPAEALGLPERYWKPWSHKKNRFVVYKWDTEADKVIIWGITARIMNTISKLIKRQRSDKDR